MTLAASFGTVGPTLTCLSLILQFVHWRTTQSRETKIADIRDHIDKLDDAVDDLSKQDKTRGLRTKGGQDLGEIFETLQAGVELAKKNSREYLREFKEETERSATLHSNYFRASIILGVIGTVLWAASSFV